MENINKYSNEKDYNFYYQQKPQCNCCNCVTSFCYCNCQCKCHKINLRENNNINFENDIPNLNINELKMKSLKEYEYNNNQYKNLNYQPNLKNINSSKNTNNIEGLKIDNNNNNGKNIFSLKRRIDNNNIENIKASSSYKNNQSQEINYINSQKNLKPNININSSNESNNYNINFNAINNHYKTQSNFNVLKKYYQLNNTRHTDKNKNNNLNYNNNTLKAQIEFNKLLNSIKGDDNNLFNNFNNNISKNISYKEMPFSDRDNKYYTKINGNLNSNRNSNNTSFDDISQINNGSRNTVNYSRSNKIIESCKDQNTSNLNTFCSNSEYNKSFLNLYKDNGNNINLSDRNKIINNNTSIQIPSNNYIKNLNDNFSSRNSIKETNNNINQNGGKSQKDLIDYSRRINQNINDGKIFDDSISYNNLSLNKSYNKLLQNLDSNLNNKNNNNTEPRFSNISRITENDNVNIKFSYLDTNNSQNEKSELLESKDINGDNNNNNFIVTFGAKGNNDLKNIIASVKNEIGLPNNNMNNNIDNGKGNENTDQKINNIIIDYENLKKRYAPNKLFTGLQNNIKDLNENISTNNNNTNIINSNRSDNNIIIDNNLDKNAINSIKKNINYSKDNFEIFLKGEPNKKIIEENENYKKEINGLNNELKESKNKIEELMIIISNYQKEVYSLKGQLSRTKRDSLNESKISSTFNNITSSNLNSTNKTRIGKDSFIIKIPENLMRNNLNREKKSRNNSLNNIKIKTNTSDVMNNNLNIKDKYINLNNINNQTNKISNINTYNNLITNNNNINIYNKNKEVYVKKITTTMKKKIKKSASQKLRINKTYNNLSLNLMNQDLLPNEFDYSNINRDININKKEIYTLLPRENKQTVLSFDILNGKFNLVDFIDYDNFLLNYNQSFKIIDNNLLNNNSIFLINNPNNNFYIVTGKNNDILYMFNNENKTMYQLCKFNDNHAKGSLISYNDKIICLSGNHNKKVEMFSETNNSLINLNEMNIERSNFSACIIDNKYIFALFGYNYPTHQCLDTIEFYELKNLENNINNNTNGCGWRYLNYKNNQFLNLSIEGHICFNYNDEKIIFFGGFNGKNNEAVDSFYQLILNGDNFNTNQAYKGVYVEKMDIKLNDIYKNGCYFFGNNNGFMFDKNLFASFDNNSNAHVLEINNMKHHIYYFE